jgi:hypothetical protein
LDVPGSHPLIHGSGHLMDLGSHVLQEWSLTAPFRCSFSPALSPWTNSAFMYVSTGGCWATAAPFPKAVSSLSKVRKARFANPRAADAPGSGPAMHRLRIRSICSWCSWEKVLRPSPPTVPWMRAYGTMQYYYLV